MSLGRLIVRKGNGVVLDITISKESYLTFPKLLRGVDEW